MLQEKLKPTHCHVSKNRNRLKSSSAFTYTFPESTFSATPSSYIDNSENLFSNNLARLAQDGLSHFSNCKMKDALTSLNKAINILENKDMETLTFQEKRIFAEVLTCKAEIIEIGSFDDAAITNQLLDQALKILPGFKKALDFKESLKADSSLSNLQKK